MSSRSTRPSARLPTTSSARAHSLIPSTLPDHSLPRTSASRKRKAEPLRDGSPISSAVSSIRKRRRRTRRAPDSVDPSANSTRLTGSKLSRSSSSSPSSLSPSPPSPSLSHPGVQIPGPVSVPASTSTGAAAAAAAPSLSSSSVSSSTVAKTASQPTSLPSSTRSLNFARADMTMSHRSGTAHPSTRHKGPPEHSNRPSATAPSGTSSPSHKSKPKTQSKSKSKPKGKPKLYTGAPSLPPLPPLNLDFSDARMLDFAQDEEGSELASNDDLDALPNSEMTGYSPNDVSHQNHRPSLQTDSDASDHSDFHIHTQNQYSALHFGESADDDDDGVYDDDGGEEDDENFDEDGEDEGPADTHDGDEDDEEDDEEVEEEEDEDEDEEGEEEEEERGTGRVGGFQDDEIDHFARLDREYSDIYSHGFFDAPGGLLPRLLGGGSTSQIGRLVSTLRKAPVTDTYILDDIASRFLLSSGLNLSDLTWAPELAQILVDILASPDFEENPNLMFSACNCMFNMVEAMPQTATALVHQGAVPVLCRILGQNLYMDIPEFILKTLRMVSRNHAEQIVIEGGLSIILPLMDFFETAVQRIAITMTANCCSDLHRRTFPKIIETIPYLQTILTGSDPKIVEQCCICVSEIFESFYTTPSLIEQLITEPLLKEIVRLVSPSNTTFIGHAVQTKLLRVLAIAAHCSPESSVQLLRLDVINVLCHVLAGAPLEASKGCSIPKADLSSVMQALARLPIGHIHSVLSLIDELFPIPVLASAVFTDNSELAHFRLLFLQQNRLARSKPNSRRVSLLQGCADKLVVAARAFIPILVELYSNTVSITVRKQVLSICVKMFAYLPVDPLREAIQQCSYASFLANILYQWEHSVLVALALRSAELLLSRDGLNYQTPMVRGGVLDVISKIAEIVTPSCAKPNCSSLGVQFDSQSPRVGRNEGEHDLGDLEEKPVQYVNGEPDEVQEEYTSSELDEDEGDYSDNQNQYDYRPHDDAGESECDDKNREDVGSDGGNGIDSIPVYADGSQSVGPESDALGGFVITMAHKFTEVYKVDGNEEASYFVRLAQRLASEIEEFVRTGDGSGAESFCKLAQFFSPSDNELTSYELLSCSIISTLNRIFFLEAPAVDPRPLFLRAFMRAESGGLTPLANLVLKLQELLSRMERFEVLTAGHNSSESSSSTNPMVALSKQLHLDLRPADSDTPSQSSGSLLVSIQAVSTFSALNDYLFDRFVVDGILSNIPNNAHSSTQSHRVRGSDDSTQQLPTSGSWSRGSGRNSRLSRLRAISQLKTTESRSRNQNEDVDENESASTAPAPSAFHTPNADSTPQTSNSKAKSTRSTLTTSREQLLTPIPLSLTNTATKKRSQPSMSFDVHFEFRYKGRTLSHDDTVLAIIASSFQKMGKGLDRMWLSRHAVEYKRVAGPAPESENKAATAVSDLSAEEIQSSLQSNSETFSLLQLLDVLHKLSESASDVLADDDLDQLSALDDPSPRFVNAKLTAKMNRQLDELLIVASRSLPPWAVGLAKSYPFLFPLATRRFFVQSTSFGYTRLLALWKKKNLASNPAGGNSNSRYYIPLPDKQKVRVSRRRILESAIKVMEVYGSIPRVLEIEYFDEVGTGLGPTLEFYTTVSKDFSRKDLRLWRDVDANLSSDSNFVSSKTGLFPAPLSEEQSKSSDGQKIIYLFFILGKFIARSLIDSRIVDFFINPVFFRLVNSRGVEASVGNLAQVDPGLAQSLKFVMRFASAKKEALASAGGESPKDITIDGIRIDDLALDFTLPGYPEFELIPDGSDVPVTMENVEKYVDQVFDATIGNGVSKQVEAFRTGFAEVIPKFALEAFTPHELVSMFGQGEEDWSYETLLDATKPDHGFTSTSSTFQNLLKAMSEFSATERRQFLQFVTGSSRLPIGGFKGLVPMLTVVRKPSEPPLKSDENLPSVMTCANYLKLPDYSSLEVLKEKVGVAMREGRGAFLLS